MTVEPLLTTADVQRVLRLSRTRTFELLHSQGFPTIRLGRCLRVEPNALRDWIASQGSRSSDG